MTNRKTKKPAGKRWFSRKMERAKQGLSFEGSTLCNNVRAAMRPGIGAHETLARQCAMPRLSLLEAARGLVFNISET